MFWRSLPSTTSCQFLDRSFGYVDERPVCWCPVHRAAEHHAQSLFSQKLFQPALGDQRQFPFLHSLGVRSDLRVSMPETNGTPSPSSRMFCPSHFTVSPSTTVSDAQINQTGDHLNVLRLQRVTTVFDWEKPKPPHFEQPATQQ
jgi:hypothetical protein